MECEGSGIEDNVGIMKSGICGSGMMESVWYKGPKYVIE